jgi:hypothetical protein
LDTEEQTPGLLACTDDYDEHKGAAEEQEAHSTHPNKESYNSHPDL